MLTCVHHLDPPVCGHAAAVLEAAGVPVRHVDRARGEALPPLDCVDGVISFGAAESVLDAGRDPRIAEEAAWLAAAAHRGTPVLGVCFGAQLLAHALGGRVFRLPRRRLEWSELALTGAGREDRLSSATPARARGLYWNEDGLQPPPDAVELYRGQGGASSGFRWGERAWGVQFHPEVDAPMLDGWYAGWPHAVDQAGVTLASARRADEARLADQSALSAALFGAFLDVAAE